MIFLELNSTVRTVFLDSTCRSNWDCFWEQNPSAEEKHKRKICLILDKLPYRYQKYISDIAGQDIHAHHNQPETAISVVRDWIGDNAVTTQIPSGFPCRENHWPGN